MKYHFISLLLGVFIVIEVCSGQQSDRLKIMMQNYLKPEGKNPVHSIQIYLASPDTTFVEAAGFSDGKLVEANKDNQFKIASITKTMTAVVILQLMEEGRVALDDPIVKYLKDNESVKVNELHFYNGKPCGLKITIRQLLQHRSGLADLFTDAAFRFYLHEFTHKKQEWSPEKLMRSYYQYGLNKKAHFTPDSGYYYSDVNYFLLGIIIEKLSGQKLAEQFRSRIFAPLNMSNSYLEYYEKAKGNGRMAHAFLGKRDITRTLNTSYDWAGGGVVSTTSDLALFMKGLFGGKLYQKETTLKTMTTMLPHTTKSGKISHYGLGLFQYSFNGDIYFGHGGFWGSLVAYCPAKQITFCGSINQVKPGFNTYEFIGKLLKEFR